MSPKTLKVVTFNALNSVVLAEERWGLLLQELHTVQAEVALLQEIRIETVELLKLFAEQHGWHVSVGKMVATGHNLDRYYGNVTLTKQKPLKTQIMEVHELSQPTAVPMLLVYTEEALLCNLHMAWGSFAEQSRLTTAHILNRVAEKYLQENPTSLVIAGGDYNTTPDSSTIRYLKGLEPYKHTSTTWTSCWDMVTDIFPTARKDGGWAEETAHSVGILHPGLMPDRTIDYLMSYGWNYGRRGCPVSLEKFGTSQLSNGYGLSDHYGLTVDFLL